MAAFFAYSGVVCSALIFSFCSGLVLIGAGLTAASSFGGGVRSKGLANFFGDAAAEVIAGVVLLIFGLP